MTWAADATTVATGQLGTAALWNAEVRDHINDLKTKKIRKSGDQTVTSSTALVNDSELLFAIAANEVWPFDFYLFIDSVTAADFKFALTCPAGGTIRYGAIAIPTGAANDPDQLLLTSDGGAGSGTALTVGGAGAGSIIPLPIRGTILNGSTAGNVQLQWAQGTSNGTGTIVHAGSFLVAHRIS